MRFARAGLGLCALALLAACDVPTSAPKWDTKWDVPSKSTTISVATLLPSGVSVTSDNSAFNVTVPAVNITRVLGDDCASCLAGDGTTMAKPQFQSLGNATATLPANVVSASTVRDTVVVTVNNGYNFDPLRPSATARGYLKITVTSGVATAAVDSVDGADIAMPAGGILVRRIPLTGIVNGAQGILVSTKIYSPAGDNVLMDAKRTVSFVASVGSFLASSAAVNVTNQPISAGATTLDLTSMGSGISDRLMGGSLIVSVTNPFNVGGTLNVKLSGPGVNIVKPLTLAGNSAAAASTLDFSAAEIQSLFGKLINLTMDGSVNETGTSVAVQPNQTVTIGTRLIVVATAGSTK